MRTETLRKQAVQGVVMASIRCGSTLPLSQPQWSAMSPVGCCVSPVRHTVAFPTSADSCMPFVSADAIGCPQTPRLERDLRPAGPCDAPASLLSSAARDKHRGSSRSPRQCRSTPVATPQRSRCARLAQVGRQSPFASCRGDSQSALSVDANSCPWSLQHSNYLGPVEPRGLDFSSEVVSACLPSPRNVSIRSPADRGESLLLRAGKSATPEQFHKTPQTTVEHLQGCPNATSRPRRRTGHAPPLWIPINTEARQRVHVVTSPGGAADPRKRQRRFSNPRSPGSEAARTFSETGPVFVVPLDFYGSIDPRTRTPQPSAILPAAYDLPPLSSHAELDTIAADTMHTWADAALASDPMEVEVETPVACSSTTSSEEFAVELKKHSDRARLRPGVWCSSPRSKG